MFFYNIKYEIYIAIILRDDTQVVFREQNFKKLDYTQFLEIAKCINMYISAINQDVYHEISESRYRSIIHMDVVLNSYKCDFNCLM